MRQTKKSRAKSRLLAIITAIAMAFTMTPAMAMAAVTEQDPGDSGTTDEFQLENPYIDPNETTVWDCVYLGRYPQSSDGEGGFVTEPIKWRVLRVRDNNLDGEADDLFLMADKNLDAKPFSTGGSTSWRSCTLRAWLNGTGEDSFYGKAFNETEKDAIMTTSVENSGGPTEDHIYLLYHNFFSYSELRNQDYGFIYYYGTHATRMAENTDYTRSQGGETSDGKYWTRSSDSWGAGVAYVNKDGKIIEDYGTSPISTDVGVRPVLHIDPTKEGWSYAGKVYSDGRVVNAITGANVTGSFTYDGNEKKPGVVALFGEEELLENIDYRVTGYSNNVNAGTATVTVEGIGEYNYFAEAEFEIQPADIAGSDVKVTLSPATVQYSGTAIRPVPTVTFKGTTLKEGKDYTISYEDNCEIGTATVKISGRGNFTGTREANFTISKYSVQNPRVDGKTTWDCIYFGQYKQSSDGAGGYATEPIKWRVLSVDGDDAFLISDRILDAKQYDEHQKEGDTYPEVTWGTSTLRSWLNGYDASKNSYGKDYSADNFINTAFSAQERSAIRTTTVSGEDVQDKIYLLSASMAAQTKYGFDSTGGNDSKTRRAKNTAYSKAAGLANDIGENDFYWLRTAVENDPHLILYVESNGRINYYGYRYNAEKNDFGVRPVLHLDLSKDVWSNAGTVTSEGTEKAGLTEATIPASEYNFTGDEITPEPVVKSHGDELAKDTDYEVRYTNNQRPGTASVTIVGKGNYTGSIIKTFKIVDPTNNLEQSEIIFDDSEITYNGDPQTPAVTVEYSDMTLKEGTDYTLKYDNNINAGTAKVTIEGTGIYTGTNIATFTIKPQSLAGADVNLDPTETNYNGTPREPEVTVSLEGKTLKQGADKDYTVSYFRNTNAGTATATISGCNNYTGAKKTSFTIKPKSLADASISFNPTVANYNGTPREPEVTVSLEGKTLKQGDYTVLFSNNIEIGTATATITGTGNYTGTAEANFAIKRAVTSSGGDTPSVTVKATKIKKVTGVKKAFYVKWKKSTSANATGYQIRYSTKSSMAKAKIKTVKGYKKQIKKIKKLKAKKRYYVQVRVYKTVNGKTYYSKWSKKKSVKTKR